jgi:hypothetical protein
MNILTTGEQDNLRELYSDVILNADYTPNETNTIIEHVLRSGNTARGVVANNVITVFEVDYNHL